MEIHITISNNNNKNIYTITTGTQLLRSYNPNLAGNECINQNVFTQ